MGDTLGSTIQNAWINAGLSRVQLSNLTGLTWYAIKRIESGETQNPYISTLHMLATTLKLDYPALLQFTRHQFNCSEESLASMLQNSRKQAGLSPEDLAVSSGLSVTVIRQIEAGKPIKIRPSTLEKLANALNLDLCKMKKFCGY